MEEFAFVQTFFRFMPNMLTLADTWSHMTDDRPNFSPNITSFLAGDTVSGTTPSWPQKLPKTVNCMKGKDRTRNVDYDSMTGFAFENKYVMSLREGRVYNRYLQHYNPKGRP